MSNKGLYQNTLKLKDLLHIVYTDKNFFEPLTYENVHFIFFTRKVSGSNELPQTLFDLNHLRCGTFIV